MEITKEWLKEKGACVAGYKYFYEKYKTEVELTQLFWLANANPKILGKVVKEMYEKFYRLIWRLSFPVTISMRL
jgi:hypothetical protein